jgi:hypothetical protein
MTNPSQNPGNPPDADAEAGDGLGPIGRVHELTWALLDEQISDAEMAELETLLKGEKEARDAYLRCVQMHVDLTLHYNPSSIPQFTAPAAKKTPVLSMLADGLPQIGSPQVGDATA